jgi:integrase
MDHIHDFVGSYYSHTKKQHKRRVIGIIRYFLEFFHTQGYPLKIFEFTFPSVRVYDNTYGIPCAFTKDEVTRLLSVIDRYGHVGKRDYAIMMLAARYGMRAKDIVTIKFDNIDWKEKTLSIVQSKTKVGLKLPLFEDVGWAIIDYIDNARPQGSSNHLFLKHHAPFDPMSGALYYLVTKYMSKAKISLQPNVRPSIRGFRHGLAREMLNNDIPITSIQEVLGHQRLESTMKYQRINIKQLSLCPLEVPDIADKKL